MNPSSEDDRRALAASEARWRAVVESAVDAIIVIDDRGVVESFNPAAERLFEYGAEEIIGKNVAMLMPEPYQSQHDGYIEHYLATREPRIIGIGREVRARRKDGSEIPIHLSVGEAFIEGGRKFTGIIRNLSERVKMEDRLREQSSLARLGELAAILAHEVKNPLAAVGGAIQMIAAHLDDPDDLAAVKEIHKRLDGLRSLVNDLLLYARPPRPTPTSFDVAELVRTLATFLHSDPALAELDVIVEGGAHMVTADAELLKIALQNLLINGGQAMQGKGRLHVRVDSAQASTIVDVIDSGPGIPAALQSNLFQPFVTTKSRGTGLGLAISRRIVEAHSGTVDILRTGPDGTTIRLALPAA